MSLDPAIHAALIVVFTWLVNLLFGLLGLDLGGETATGLATVIVGYVLSLFGYSLYTGFLRRPSFSAKDNPYRPPFT